jgi:hypothetical protein
MKRVHYAILTGEALSYALIIVFIFADAMYDLTGVFRADTIAISPQFAYVSACLVGIVGCINVWLTWYYMHKAATMRDWLIVCAWTHRIKRAGRWLTLEEFLTEHLGYQVSHGLSEASLLTMRDEADARWRSFPTAPASEEPSGDKPQPASGATPGPVSG